MITTFRKRTMPVQIAIELHKKLGTKLIYYRRVRWYNPRFMDKAEPVSYEEFLLFYNLDVV